MKVLFITKKLNQKKADGGLAVSIRNYEMLKKSFSDENVDLLEFNQPNLKRKLVNLLFKQSYGQTKENFSAFKRMIAETKYDYVFFNSSLYGNLVKFCKDNGTRTFVFFHNVESNYYKDLWKQKKSILYFMFYKYVTNLEKKSCKYSTYKILLNERDNKELQKVYNYSADLLLPISMKKKCKSMLINTNENEKFCMFLGSDFFANQHGVSWFIENVAPYINIPCKIAGSICNSMKLKYPNAKNIEFVGYVDDLDGWYRKASFIVSPIFLGSGMKTKTVEALSYGKAVIGTDEAFVGIEADFSKLGGKCNTKEEFIDSINSFDKGVFNEYSFEWFLNNLSDECIVERYKVFLQTNN